MRRAFMLPVSLDGLFEGRTLPKKINRMMVIHTSPEMRSSVEVDRWGLDGQLKAQASRTRQVAVMFPAPLRFWPPIYSTVCKG